MTIISSLGITPLIRLLGIKLGPWSYLFTHHQCFLHSRIKTVVTLVCEQWSYCSFVLSHRNIYRGTRIQLCISIEASPTTSWYRDYYCQPLGVFLYKMTIRCNIFVDSAFLSGMNAYWVSWGLSVIDFHRALSHISSAVTTSLARNCGSCELRCVYVGVWVSSDAGVSLESMTRISHGVYVNRQWQWRLFRWCKF